MLACRLKRRKRKRKPRRERYVWKHGAFPRHPGVADVRRLVQVDGTSRPASGRSTPAQSALHSEPHVEPTAGAHAAPTGVSPTGTAASASGAPAASASAPVGTESGATASAASSLHGHGHGHAHSHASGAEAGAAKSHLAGKPPKLSAEQKQKAYEEEKKSWEEKRQRIETLAQKLRERVRPFVDAAKPGDKDDPETKRFAERMRDEARDLAMESFGVGESAVAVVVLTTAQIVLTGYPFRPWQQNCVTCWAKFTWPSA